MAERVSMEEKERMRQEKKGVKKKVPMRESNLRPLNLCCYSMRINDQTSRFYIYIYISQISIVMT